MKSESGTNGISLLENEGDVPEFVFPTHGVGATLRHVHRLYMRLLQEHLATRGLTVAKYLHLRILWEGDGLPQNEISHRLGIEKASSTGALDALEREGLIRRVRDESDRRRVLVHLSPKGQALRDTILSHALQVAHVAGQGASEEELSNFFRTADRMIANLERALGKTGSRGSAPGSQGGSFPDVRID